MKILVTGGAGFIGSHIVDKYILEGHNVIIVDNLLTGNLENVNPEAKFYQVDLTNINELEEVFKLEKPEIVSHHAAQISAPGSVNNPLQDAEINIIGGINLLQMAEKYKVKRIIYSSSAACYGEPINLPVDENHPCSPQTPYGVSKYAFEFYLANKAKLVGFDYVIFRYANVYGPRQSNVGEGGIIATFAKEFLDNSMPKIFGKGNKTRDYIYVSDIVNANFIALNTQKTNQIYNLGTGKRTSDKEVFKNFQKLTKLIKIRYAPDRPGDIQHFYYNPEKAEKLLGWKAKIIFANGLKDTIKFYQNHNS